MGLGRKSDNTRRQQKVLVIDPRGDDLDHTSRVMSEAGFRVVSLSRYDAAGPVFSMLQPDVVMIAASRNDDLQGIRTAQRLRALAQGSVAVYFLVDSMQSDVRQQCLEKGKGLDVLVKPVEGAELVAKVQSLLGLRDAMEKANRLEMEARGPTLHDPLTGVYNKQFLLAMIAQEARRGERYGGNFSVLAMALNGFGQFRKELGKEASDKVLVYASMLLTQTMREADMVARVGDDCFSVLLPGTPFEQLPRLSARLVERFEAARFQVEGKALRTSIAVGSVSFPDLVGTAPQLLDAAFADLKRAQQAAAKGQKLTRLML